MALLGILFPAALAQAGEPACNEFRDGGVEDAFRTQSGHDRACYRLGMELIRQAGTHDFRLREAENIFKTLLRHRPQAAYAYAGFADLKMRRRELGLSADDSIAAIRDEAERATRLGPTLPEAHVTLGWAELLAGCIPCAARAAEIARALGADTPALPALRARIAESGKDLAQARSILAQAIAAPGVAAQDRSWLGGALAEVLARNGRFEEAERALTAAIAADDDNLAAHLGRAEIRLFHLGDVQGAQDVLGANRRAATTVAFKRIQSMIRYLQWCRDQVSGRSGEDLNRIVQVAYLGPEDAMVVLARHPVLMREFEAMLNANLAGRIDARDGAGNTALLAAAAGGNVVAVRLLIGRGADVDAADRRGRRPVSFAVDASNHEVLAMLLQAGAAVDFADKDGRSPLLRAVQQADGRSVALLLRQRAVHHVGPPDGAAELLIAAATHGDVASLSALMDAGVPADAQGRHGGTALLAAVQWGRVDAARLLLERGADASRALKAAQDAIDGVMLELLQSFLKRST